MKTPWKEERGTLTKTFTFRSFNEALLFVNKVGALAEQHQHHPDITLQNYNQVIITTTTHDQGSTITSKDYAVAEAIDILRNKSRLKRYLSKYRILEFIVAGLAIDLVENILTLKVISDEPITGLTVLIALVVVIPFAVLTELVIDHPTFWQHFRSFLKKIVGTKNK